jgi:hypothetical protein
MGARRWRDVICRVVVVVVGTAWVAIETRAGHRDMAIPAAIVGTAGMAAILAIGHRVLARGAHRHGSR